MRKKRRVRGGRAADSRPCGVVRSRGVRRGSAGRRGRRPLRVRSRGVSVVGAAALGRPRTWRKAGETGRRGRRPLRRRTNVGRNQHGTSRTPSPTGRCEYRARVRICGRGKPLPYGVVRISGAGRGTAPEKATAIRQWPSLGLAGIPAGFMRLLRKYRSEREP